MSDVSPSITGRRSRPRSCYVDHFWGAEFRQLGCGPSPSFNFYPEVPPSSELEVGFQPILKSSQNNVPLKQLTVRTLMQSNDALYLNSSATPMQMLWQVGEWSRLFAQKTHRVPPVPTQVEEAGVYGGANGR
jgi:hypothetical protein